MVQRALAILVGLIFLASALVFATIAAGAIIAIGLLAWAWAWWRGKGRSKATPQSVVIEGEFRDETHLERLGDLRRR